MEETTSTNDALRGWSREAPLPHGAAVAARHQTSGRGRQGRRWESPPGSACLLSVLIRRPLTPGQAPLLCLAAAVATADVAGRPYRIKWPNDVLAPDGRKVGGILAEAEWNSGARHLDHAIVGIGLNVTGHPALGTATDLEEVDGVVRDVVQLADALRTGLLEWVERLEEAPARVLSAWTARSATLGRAVRVGAVEGTAVAVDPDGALRVRTASGREERVLAGDVEMITPSAR